jgi:SAM-dependent methyltransferase
VSARFAVDWLQLREPFDARARSRELAERFAAALPAHPALLDLGAGTGSLFRWLAPIIGRAQVWTLVDVQAELLQRAFEEIADWSAGRGYAFSSTGHSARRALLVQTPRGPWRVQTMLADLASTPDGLPLARADGVVCSAMLDLVSAAWIEQFCDALASPLLACLSVDGRDAFLPRGPFDAVVRGGFRHDQGADKGFGRALGWRAPATLHAALRTRGFAVRSAPSPWHIAPRERPMLEALVPMQARVAARWRPRQRGEIATWQRTRLHQITAARLAIRIGHSDSLALPGED